ncbi:MAG: ATP-binding protein [Eubacterium sp.]|nr:ATP-binding protein [Eubacterium sp.]
MERDLMKRLVEWKNGKRRKPLLLQGARQVGKTWLVKEFGRREFTNTAYINFDENHTIHSVFDGDLDTDRLIIAIKAQTGLDISADDSLIVFDEVQECPRALTSLKYFCENAPEYAIIATGSLLGVAMHPGTTFPVGKVDRMTLYPLSFSEFLRAQGKTGLVDLLNSDDEVSKASFHGEYVDFLRQYYFVGGMPEAVDVFLEERSFSRVSSIHKTILDMYRQDFSKHADSSLIPRLNMVWSSIPAQLAKENKKFIYGVVRQGARAKDYELAIQWLEDSGLIHKVFRTKKAGIPLSFYADQSSFKIYMADIGLLCAMSQINERVVIEGNRLFVEFKGALTEQFVLQQLVTMRDQPVYYYSAENARTEIDFLVDGPECPIPIEVKAEENLRAKSLRVFCAENDLTGVRFSMSGYRDQGWMKNIPLYDVGAIIP